MLAKKDRLNLKTDFKWAVDGKKSEGRYLKLFVRLGENETPKVGIATSSKIFKKAHERNRARRLVSAAIAPLLVNLVQNVNILVLPKMGTIDVKSTDLLMELKQLLEGLKVLNEKSRNISD